MNNHKQLYRSTSDKMIAGVCGGIAEYFNLDSTFVRILWVLIALIGGSGLILYLAALIIIPLNPQESKTKPKPKTDSKQVWGIILLLLGVILLLGRLQLYLFHWNWGLGWKILAPVLLIAAGVILILSHDTRTRIKSKISSSKQMYRIQEGRMLLGIAGGTAEYFNLDIALARLIWVLFIIFTSGLGLLLYFIMYFIIPPKSQDAINGDDK